MPVYFNRTKKILEGVRDFEGHFKIPSTVVRIGEMAFDASCNITEIEIPDSVKFLSPQCLSSLNVTSIVLPAGISEIPTLCCFGCHQLKTVTLPDTVTRIGGMAFSECFELESIHVPASVTHIEPDAFRYVPKLKLTVSPDNPVFYEKDGWIYSKDGATVFIKGNEENNF